MNKEELKDRTKKFARTIIRLVDDLPNTRAGYIVSDQIMRSGTSVAANYRSACRARSNADFLSKITLVEEECDETLFWLELIAESGLIKPESIKNILTEADELTAIFTASGRTARNNIQKSKKINSAIRNPQSAIRLANSKMSLFDRIYSVEIISVIMNVILASVFSASF